MNWSARGNVLNQYLRNTSIGTTVIDERENDANFLHSLVTSMGDIRNNILCEIPVN
jgi:hypothetical protein